MLELHEYEKMQRMILAFSNYLRYIFHDNLKVVPLKYELEEVNDYYNIILMDRFQTHSAYAAEWQFSFWLPGSTSFDPDISGKFSEI